MLFVSKGGVDYVIVLGGGGGCIGIIILGNVKEFWRISSDHNLSGY